MRVIDLMHQGRARAIAAWLDGDVIIDCGPTSTLATLLAGLGETRPSALLLTHIHLDHAAGAGALRRAVARAPRLRPRARGPSPRGSLTSALQRSADLRRRA